MMPYFNWYVSYNKKITKDKVHLGDNSSHDVKGQGTVKITLENGETRTIENVLYIPAFKKSLISVSRVTNGGYHIEFRTNSCLIKYKDGKTLITWGKGVDNLYKLDTSHTYDTNLPHIVSNANFSNVKLWHQRLGHPSLKKLKVTYEDQSYMDFTSKLEILKYVCVKVLWRENKVVKNSQSKEDNVLMNY